MLLFGVCSRKAGTYEYGKKFLRGEYALKCQNTTEIDPLEGEVLQPNHSSPQVKNNIFIYHRILKIRRQIIGVRA